MKYNKVVYFRYMPLTIKIAKDLYMLELKELTLQVEYWDLTNLFFKDTSSMEDSSGIIETVKFESIEQFEKAVKNETIAFNVLFISIVTFEGRVKQIYDIFTKYNCKIAVFGRNMFPLPGGHERNFFSRLKRINLNKIIAYVKNKFVLYQKRTGKIKSYDIIFAGGIQGWKGVGNIEYSEVVKSKIVKLNSDDYDNYLNQREELSIINGEYILFLDEYLPLHPDTKLFNIKNIKPEHYYPELCLYFNRVEEQFGMPVVIAAHPKALLYRDKNFFEGRQVIFDKTAVLSKFAHFVLAHDTTSINYPIAFGTKLHFISSDAIEREINSVHINSIKFAQYLGCNFQYFNRINDKISIVVDLPRIEYQKYKYNFQTWPETENKQSKEIFVDFFKN